MLIAQSRTSSLDCKICSSSPRFGGVLGFADTTEQIWLENAFVYYSSTFEWDLKGKWSSLRARLAVARGLSASASLSDSVRRALLWTQVVEMVEEEGKRGGEGRGEQVCTGTLRIGSYVGSIDADRFEKVPNLHSQINMIRRSSQFTVLHVFFAPFP